MPATYSYLTDEETKDQRSKIICLKLSYSGTSLVVQWVRLHAPNAGGLGSIPGQGTRSRMPQLKIPQAAMKILQAAMKILQAATKTHHSQINKQIKYFKNKNKKIKLSYCK